MSTMQSNGADLRAPAFRSSASKVAASWGAASRGPASRGSASNVQASNTLALTGLAQRESFACRIERDPDGRVLAVTLEATTPTATRSIRVHADKATQIAAAVHDVLRSGGVSGRAWTQASPLALEYLVGAQLELLLVAVAPMRRADRVSHVSTGVAAMSIEEASYWHAKLSRPGGLPALRVLLGAGRRR